MADGNRPERRSALADVQCSSEREHATSLIRIRGESSKSGTAISSISSSARVSDSSKIVGGGMVVIVTTAEFSGVRPAACFIEAVGRSNVRCNDLLGDYRRSSPSPSGPKVQLVQQVEIIDAANA